MIIDQCLHAFRHLYCSECGEWPPIAGAAISRRAQREILEVCYSLPNVPSDSDDNTRFMYNAIHLVPVNDAYVARIGAEVIFFTDLEVWKRFLQHTDD